jgi:hypothetical protein
MPINIAIPEPICMPFHIGSFVPSYSECDLVDNIVRVLTVGIFYK